MKHTFSGLKEWALSDWVIATLFFFEVLLIIAIVMNVNVINVLLLIAVIIAIVLLFGIKILSVVKEAIK